MVGHLPDVVRLTPDDVRHFGGPQRKHVHYARVPAGPRAENAVLDSPIFAARTTPPCVTLPAYGIINTVLPTSINDQKQAPYLNPKQF